MILDIDELLYLQMVIEQNLADDEINDTLHTQTLEELSRKFNKEINKQINQ
tara:strand:+ start:240 stop:392 length:153 start_codon:yes stop_codon:yes gene_type:complete